MFGGEMPRLGQGITTDISSYAQYMLYNSRAVLVQKNGRTHDRPASWV